MIRKLVLFLAVVGLVTAAVDNNCKKGSEYCQNHSECCTGTCLSYLYKCSKLNKLPAGSVPLQYAPEVVVRIGDEQNESAPLALTSLLQLLFTPTELASGRDLPAIEQRVGESETSTTEAPNCFDIGSKCYFNNECCSQRCHGFLHQCVT